MSAFSALRDEYRGENPVKASGSEVSSPYHSVEANSWFMPSMCAASSLMRKAAVLPLRSASDLSTSA